MNTLPSFRNTCSFVRAWATTMRFTNDINSQLIQFFSIRNGKYVCFVLACSVWEFVFSMFQMFFLCSICVKIIIVRSSGRCSASVRSCWKRRRKQLLWKTSLITGQCIYFKLRVIFNSSRLGETQSTQYEYSVTQLQFIQQNCILCNIHFWCLKCTQYISIPGFVCLRQSIQRIAWKNNSTWLNCDRLSVKQYLAYHSIRKIVSFKM